MFQKLQIFAFFLYVLGCKLSLFRLCGSNFGITPVDDITNGIAWAVFCFHIAHISFATIIIIIIIIIIIMYFALLFGLFYADFEI